MAICRLLYYSHSQVACFLALLIHEQAEVIEVVILY